MTDTPADLSGHVAFVTGASRGIGRATARRLAAHGAAIVVSASGRSTEGLHETVKLIESAGGRAAAIEADLGDSDARSGLIARAAQPFGPIDILVNNAAAISAYAPPSKIDLPARRAMFEINLHGPIDLVQQALPAMKEKRWGRIVNVTSETVNQPPIPYVGSPKFIHALALYGASKSALDRYTRALAAELHGTGIHVNAVKPYKIALSENAEAVARQAQQSNPDWIEPLEMMAEGAYVLIAHSLTGLVLNSREIMQMTQQPLHALDGRTIIGDATTLGRVDG